ncbi:hypothetical protein JD969_00130 [Planctomycetota bacterium]|nr:hypothetical protein JD969_00130 [Planctomycetota bacterium]
MKKLTNKLIIIAISTLSSVASTYASTITSVMQSPNVIIILTDDQSWVDAPTEMIPGNLDTKSDYYHTPNIDYPISSGMQFSHGYIPAPY